MVKIKSIITALGNPKLSNSLLSNKYEIKSYDIQYKEGILEYLEENNNIDCILISKNLPGNIKIEDLIKKIKEKNEKIKIIIYSSEENEIDYGNNVKTIKKMNKEEIEKELLVETKKKNTNIYNKKTIIEKNENQKEEINKIKKEKNINKKENTKIIKYKKYTKQNISKKEIIVENETNGKVISITGTNGIGKSIFSVLFSQNIESSKKIIIDFDILNNSLHTILGIKQYTKKIKETIEKEEENQLNFDYININNFICKTKYGIDIISGMNLIFDSKKQTSPSKIRNIIKEIKKQYDVIVIDTSSYGLLDYTKEILNISDNIIFISGANNLEIKKSENLLKIYEKEWGVEKRKIKIIFNKYSSNSLDIQVLRNIFKNYVILGTIKLRDYYDFIINQKKTDIKKIKIELEKIQKMLTKNEKNLKEIQKII